MSCSQGQAGGGEEESMASMMRNVMSRLGHLERDNVDMKNVMKQQRDTIHDLESTISQMSKTMEELRNKAHQLELELITERTNRAALEKQLLEVREERDRLQAERNKLEEQLQNEKRRDGIETVGLEGESEMTNEDTATPRGQRFIPIDPTDFDRMIQSAQLPEDTKVAVLVLAGVECPEKILQTILLLKYLDQRSDDRDTGCSVGNFIDFLSRCDNINSEEFKTSLCDQGLYIWPRLFQLAEKVAVLVFCAVGALQTDLMTGDVSSLLNRAVLCGSVLFAHLSSSASGVGDVTIHDCLHAIMVSTGFVLCSTSFSTVHLFPQRCLLNSNEGHVGPAPPGSGASAASSSSGPILTCARDTIRQIMVNQFRERAFSSDGCERIEWPSINAEFAEEIADDLRLNKLPKFYLSRVFHLFERVLGREEEMPPLKFGFDGQAVNLGEFMLFFDQVRRVANQSQLIFQWHRQAMQTFARKLCEQQISDERFRESLVSAFSTNDLLEKMWERDILEGDAWNRLESFRCKLTKILTAFDDNVSTRNSQMRVALRQGMTEALTDMRDVVVSEDNVACKWVQNYYLIEGEISTEVRSQVHVLLGEIENGNIKSTRRYIETRNSLLDVTKLLNSCSTLSTDSCLMSTYRSIEFHGVRELLWSAKDKTNRVWAALQESKIKRILSWIRGEPCYASIYKCAHMAFEMFLSKLARILSTTVVNDSVKFSVGAVNAVSSEMGAGGSISVDVTTCDQISPELISSNVASCDSDMWDTRVGDLISSEMAADNSIYTNACDFDSISISSQSPISFSVGVEDLISSEMKEDDLIRINNLTNDAVVSNVGYGDSISFNISTDGCIGAVMDSRLEALRQFTLSHFDNEIAKERSKLRQKEQRDHFDWIVSDQRSVLCDQIQYWIATYNQSRQYGLNMQFLVDQSPQMSAVQLAIRWCISTDDQLSFCLHSLPVDW